VITQASALQSAVKESSADEAPQRPRTRELLPRGATAVAVTALSAVLIAISFADFGLSGRALVGAVMCPVLVLLAAIDFKHRLIPNDIVLPGALLMALVVAAVDSGKFFEHLWAGLALGLFLVVFATISRSGLGMGDAKLGLLLGLALGSRTLEAMMVAFAGLFVAALWILATQGMSARKKAIPFGPFIALGGILAFFLG
jgi:prepilin signal peptidase PulO-like enzyme (type II secretory pathway)